MTNRRSPTGEPAAAMHAGRTVETSSPTYSPPEIAIREYLSGRTVSRGMAWFLVFGQRKWSLLSDFACKLCTVCWKGKDDCVQYTGDFDRRYQNTQQQHQQQKQQHRGGPPRQQRPHLQQQWFRGGNVLHRVAHPCGNDVSRPSAPTF